MNDRMIIHIPHSSMYIPKEYADYFSADPDTIVRNLISLTDFATEDLFCHPKHQNRLVFPISRLICDVERFRKDDDEIMSKQGMGVVYTHGAYGETLRPYNESLREEVFIRYYDPHHEAFFEKVMAVIGEVGYCIIVDAHSFPSNPLPYELCQDPYRADFCIGTDIIHTPVLLTKEICNCIIENGYTVELNNPYSGTIVPLQLYGFGSLVMSVMIEVNRRLYMDEADQILSPHYELIKNIIFKILETIERWVPE